VSHHAAIQNPKWLALVEFEEEVKSASVKARSLGQGAEEELAKAYLVLNDKSYLDQILMSLELKRAGDISEFELLRQKFENVYSLDKQIVAAVLHDGRAVGFLNDRYRLFEDINSYREAIGRHETFGRVTSEPHIAAFVKGIPHLHEQILQG
jgi:predicted GNAT superfamily acetyltransferase